MPDKERINAECSAFTRYLTGQLPDLYTSEKYAAAFLHGQPLSENLKSEFDSLLVRLAVIHPLFTRAVDAFSRFFYAGSALRKRLIILLAIIETRASTVVELDYPDKSTLAGSIFSMTIQFTVFTILFAVAVVFLLPLKLLLGRQPVKNQGEV